MPATKRLVLDLPVETVDMIEARVAGGQFASASAYIAERIADEDALPFQHEDLDSPEMQAWLAESDEIERRIDAGVDEVIPIEKVFADLRAHLEQLRRKEDASRRAAG